METHIIIENRYRGTSDSGNGGYTCGLLANLIEGTAEVTLRHPPPQYTHDSKARQGQTLSL